MQKSGNKEVNLVEALLTARHVGAGVRRAGALVVLPGDHLVDKNPSDVVAGCWKIPRSVCLH